MKRVRTVEHETGWGWIARDPATGREVIPEFRWRTRSAARDVVAAQRALARDAAAQAAAKGEQGNG